MTAQSDLPQIFEKISLTFLKIFFFSILDFDKKNTKKILAWIRKLRSNIYITFISFIFTWVLHFRFLVEEMFKSSIQVIHCWNLMKIIKGKNLMQIHWIPDQDLRTMFFLSRGRCRVIQCPLSESVLLDTMRTRRVSKVIYR